MTTDKTDFQCSYCAKHFQRERSLAVHVCETKRRYLNKTERSSQLAHQAYVKFYELAQPQGRVRTFDDFVASQYYRAFVRWGQYCVDIRAVNPEAFLTWLLKYNKKIDHWCKDSLYDEYLHDYLPREGVQDALSRGIQEIQNYTDQNPDLANLVDYFRYGSHSRVCHDISTGRVSAWVVFNCQSGAEFVEKLRPDQAALIMPWINPDVWQPVFAARMDDVRWAQHILAQAGL